MEQAGPESLAALDALFGQNRVVAPDTTISADGTQGTPDTTRYITDGADTVLDIGSIPQAPNAPVVEANGVPAANGQQPVPDSGQTSPTPDSNQQGNAAGHPATEPVAMENIIEVKPGMKFQTPEGLKTWEEIEREKMNWSKYRTSANELADERKRVDANKRFTDFVASDPFTATYAQAIAAGASKEEARNAALAVTGSQQTNQQVAPTAPEAPKEYLANGDSNPDFTRDWAEYIASRLEAKMGPRISALENKFVEEREAKIRDEAERERLTTQYAANISYNDQLAQKYLRPILTQAGPEAQAELSNKLNQLAVELNIPVAGDEYAMTRLHEHSVAYLASRLKEEFVSKPTAPVQASQQMPANVLIPSQRAMSNGMPKPPAQLPLQPGAAGGGAPSLPSERRERFDSYKDDFYSMSAQK